MPEIQLKDVLSFSTEDKMFPASNLTKPESFKKWHCQPGDKQAFVSLQLSKASEIHEIHIGNDGSAFVEVLVARSGEPQDDYQVILVASSFMSPMESRNSQNLNRVRCFGHDKLSQAVKAEKWDRIRIVCSQPFNKSSKYGLTFIKLYSPPGESNDNVEKVEKSGQIQRLGAFKLKAEEGDDISAGSLFARRGETAVTGAAAVRAAARRIDEEGTAHSSTAGESTLKLKRKPELSPDTPPSLPKATKTGDNSPTSLIASKPSGSKAARSQKTEDKPKVKKVSTVTKVEGKTDANVPLIRAKTDPVRNKSPQSAKKPKRKNFNSILKGVVFALSGFQNPVRGDLRDEALEMGATYKADWGKGCTHLICAFENTPKYNQVRGQGRIVKKEWLTDCYNIKKKLPWRKYRLGRAPSPADASDEDSTTEDEEVPGRSQESKDYGSETEDEAMEEASVANPQADVAEVSQSQNGKQPATASTAISADDDDAVYDLSTDDEEEACDSGFAELPDLFSGRSFFFYGSFEPEEKRQLNRLVVAYDGEVEEYMNSKVTYVISNSEWDSHFDDAVAGNDKLLFVRAEWLTACHAEQKMLPAQKFLIIPD